MSPFDTSPQAVAPDDDDDNNDMPDAPKTPIKKKPVSIDHVPSTKKLDAKERQNLIKEKLAKRKINRRGSSLVAAADMDTLSHMIQQRKAEGPDELAEELTMS